MESQAGDIIFESKSDDVFRLYFLGEEMEIFQGLKVGEFEKSSFEDFKSFIDYKMQNNIYSVEFTFSIKRPQLDPRIIVTALILLLLLLPFLFLVYFKFK